MQTISEKKPFHKKLATAAFAGMLAVGAFSAAPAFAGSHSNGCSASGCNKKTEKSSCSGKSGCKGKTSCKVKASCKGKHSCKGANSCKDKHSCKDKSSCKDKTCKGKTDHSDNENYND